MNHLLGMLRKQITIVILTAQVSLPGLTDIKAAMLAVYRRVLSKPREHAFLALKYLKISGERPLLDIGGAQGQSVAAMRLYARKARIISFEPNPFFAAKIKKRFLHDPNVRVETLALSDIEGQYPLYIPVYKYCAFPELGTLQRIEAENWLPSRLIGYRANNLTIAEFPCKCCRLDSLSLDPEVIKIDCRCNASSVIQGATSTISSCKPIIILEAATLSEVSLGFLTELGYRTYHCHNGRISEVEATKPCDLLLTTSHTNRSEFEEWSRRSTNTPIVIKRE